MEKRNLGQNLIKIDHLEEKLRMIQNKVEKRCENEEREERERLKRKELLEKIKGKREAAVLRGETIEKEKLKKEEMIKRRWEMLEWLTDFLEENQEMWEKEKKKQISPKIPTAEKRSHEKLQSYPISPTPSFSKKASPSSAMFTPPQYK